MSAVKDGNDISAEADFKAILSQYPSDRLADNAAFWLGEIYMGRNDYAGALAAFDRVVKEYPVGDKVPDAVYRKGLAYEALGQADRARDAYNRVMDNYPYSDAARSARARLEGLGQP
jgi:tol-pal system protein YbgF